MSEYMSDRGWSEAQETMAREMSEISDKSSPKTIGQILDEEVGLPLDRDEAVVEAALQVIEEGPNLTLGFREWSRVQALVEAGIRRGYEMGRESEGDRSDLP